MKKMMLPLLLLVSTFACVGPGYTSYEYLNSTVEEEDAIALTLIEEHTGRISGILTINEGRFSSEAYRILDGVKTDSTIWFILDHRTEGVWKESGEVLENGALSVLGTTLY